MRQAMFELFQRLQNNSINQIVFYKNNRRQVKTFQDFLFDVDKAIGRINSLEGIKKVAIVGPISYEWMVLDFACIKGGLVSIAVPETLSCSAIHSILDQNTPDLVLVDQCYEEKEIGKGIKLPLFYFRCTDKVSESSNFELLNSIETIDEFDKNKIQEVYSIAFSSGTSGNIKQINLSFNEQEIKPKPWYLKVFLFRKIVQLWWLRKYKWSFWSRSDNKLIIFMPFSHLQQRSFVLTALFNNINIVLSDSMNCVKHLIIEKPNIMVSVPLIYEILAENVNKKISQFSKFQSIVFKLYNVLCINGFSNRNPLKKWVSNYLFKDIKKIYGGRADYFITGSAPIKKQALEIFYSVGVKVFEAYGQSEIGVISMSSESNFKLGSVGKPVVKVKIGEQSEILVEYKETEHKYRKENLKIDSDGYIHTGDVGFLSKEGFLFVKGRIDDVIVLKNGKKIFPDTIDLKLTSFEKIKHAVTICRDDKLTAILSLADYASKEEVKSLVNSVNKDLPDYSQISSYLLIPGLTIENGMLTSTFKVKRKEVIERFKEQLSESIKL